MSAPTTPAENLRPDAIAPASDPGAPRYVCILFPPEPADARPDAVPFPLRKVWPAQPNQIIATVLPAETAPLNSPVRLAIPFDTLQLGRNVQLNPDQSALLATRAGHILLTHSTLSVEETLQLADDLDATTGPVEFAGDILLHKNVLDLVKIVTGGNLTVHGSIEAATVESAGNITVHHGICGKERGSVRAAGNISARFASNAAITAGGDILIGKDVVSSRLLCRGKLVGENASILSGQMQAGQGILCDTAGTEAGVKVLLELTLPPDEIDRITRIAARLKQLRDHATHIRTAIEPLMKDPKRLTREQKEKATELLCTAAEADDEIATLAASLQPVKAQLEQMMRSPIHIKNRIYPGVTLSIAGVQTTIRSELRGPLKFTRQDEPGAPRIVMADGHNRTTALPIATTKDYEILHQLLIGAL